MPSNFIDIEDDLTDQYQILNDKEGGKVLPLPLLISYFSKA
jgi:hypothetical protein